MMRDRTDSTTELSPQLRPELAMAQSPEDNKQMEDWAETDLAWQLVEIACLLLPDHDRIDLYTAIGAGYSYAAIGRLLETVVSADVAVCPSRQARIANWMTAYAHHPDAPRLREMLTAVRTAS
jgi:hypothetical protein